MVDFKLGEFSACYYQNGVFDEALASKDCVEWIRSWFEENGPACRAIVGISGGKDSAVAAALCVEALGRERVLGVLMPNGVQPDIGDAREICSVLGIESVEIDIADAVGGVLRQLEKTGIEPSNQTKVNLPARIRMATLYAVSQSKRGRVANTCNLSEDWVGYSTRYGDSVGDFAPLGSFTVSEAKAIGHYLGLPSAFVEKAPSDGLSGRTDEDALGFSYAELDAYIRLGVEPSAAIKRAIDDKHQKNLFKLETMPTFGR